MVLIEGTPIVVDEFRHFPQLTQSLYFLSHFHTDHTSGLAPSWDLGIVYCSEITKKLFIHRVGVEQNRVVVLDVGHTYCLPFDDHSSLTFNVTLIDANHCPGAVMFLFEGYFGTVLHTGDFRYHPRMLEYPCLKQLLPPSYCAKHHSFHSSGSAHNQKGTEKSWGHENENDNDDNDDNDFDIAIFGKSSNASEQQEEHDKWACSCSIGSSERKSDQSGEKGGNSTVHGAGTLVIDRLYLDNTFFHPAFDYFLNFDGAVDEIVSIIRSYPGYDVLLGVDNLGKEEILLRISHTLEKLLVVDEARYRELKLILPYEHLSLFTTNRGLSNLRVVSRKEVTAGAISWTNQDHPTIGIILSGWCLTSRKKSGSKMVLERLQGPPVPRHPLIHLIPFSSHCSYNEIVEFVSRLKPRQLIANGKNFPLHSLAKYLTKPPSKIPALPRQFLKLGKEEEFLRRRRNLNLRELNMQNSSVSTPGIDLASKIRQLSRSGSKVNAITNVNVVQTSSRLLTGRSNSSNKFASDLFSSHKINSFKDEHQSLLFDTNSPPTSPSQFKASKPTSIEFYSKTMPTKNDQSSSSVKKEPLSLLRSSSPLKQQQQRQQTIPLHQTVKLEGTAVPHPVNQEKAEQSLDTETLDVLDELLNSPGKQQHPSPPEHQSNLTPIASVKQHRHRYQQFVSSPPEMQSSTGSAPPIRTVKQERQSPIEIQNNGTPVAQTRQRYSQLVSTTPTVSPAEIRRNVTPTTKQQQCSPFEEQINSIVVKAETPGIASTRKTHRVLPSFLFQKKPTKKLKPLPDPGTIASSPLSAPLPAASAPLVDQIGILQAASSLDLFDDSLIE